MRSRVVHSVRFPLTIAILACTSPVGEAGVLFDDDFSGPLREGWILFGEPLPILSDSTGLPAPSFDNNGDSMYDSGAMSRGSWDCSEGLVVECDMYITSNQRGAWIAGTIGLIEAETAVYGQDGIASMVARLSYNYAGEANWSCPHLQGQMVTSVYSPDGEKDECERLHFNDYLDSWHRYRIVVEMDRTVSFFVDDLLLFHSESTLTRDIGALSVVLGNRSGSWGRVFHDNLLVRTLD